MSLNIPKSARPQQIARDLVREYRRRSADPRWHLWTREAKWLEDRIAAEIRRARRGREGT